MTDSARSQLWVAASTLVGAGAGVAITSGVEGTLVGGIVGLVVYFFFEWRVARAPSKPS